MVFFAVAREGLESVFFLLAVFQQSGADAPLGALLGVVAAAAIGYGVYAGGVRLDLRRFFRWTGVLIVFVAAGLAAGALRHLHEAGLWNHLQGVVVDFSDVMPVDRLPGLLLSGLFGYTDAPTLGEVIVYFAFLGVSLAAFLAPTPASPAQRQAHGA
jgi:high-affinity iron transporter